MTRAEMRVLAQRLVRDYSVPFSLALKTVKLGVWARCEALAAGEKEPAKSFLAAAQVLTK